MRLRYPKLGFLAAIFFILTPRPVESSNGAVAVACHEPASETHYDTGVTDDSILLGATMPKTKGASSYYQIAIAEQAYFDYIYDTQGGVNGRKIIFKVEDDALDPAQTSTKTIKLVEDDQVFLMFGSLGSATQLNVRNYLNDQKVPQLFVGSGLTTFSADYASFPFTLGWQTSYQSEARIYAQSIIANDPDAKIGVLYDDSVEGRDYLVGLKDGLGPNVSLIVAEKSVLPTANALQVFAAVQFLKDQGVDTIFIFMPPQHSIFSLVRITLLAWTPNIYLNAVSNLERFMVLAASFGAALDNVTSLRFQDPRDPAFEGGAGSLLYQQIITNYCEIVCDDQNPNICWNCDANDPLNLYGVGVAYSMVDVLEHADSNLTRCNIMDIAANRLKEKNYYANPFLLPGVWVKTTPSDHFPITQGQLMTWSKTLSRWGAQGGIMDGTIRPDDAGDETEGD